MIKVTGNGNEQKIILALAECRPFFIKNTGNCIDLSIDLDEFVQRVLA